MMEKKHSLKTLIFTLILVLFSCVATKHKGNDLNNVIKYDAATFDYVYVEALKQKLLGNGGEALKYLEQCIKFNPQSDAAYFQMAQIVLASGDLNNGKKYAEKAYKIDDRNIWYIMMLSGIYYQQGNLDSAIIVYEKSSVYYPQKQNFQITLANMYAEKKDFNKAITIYENLEQKFGLVENITYGYIQNLIKAGKYKEALLKTESAIKEFPAGIQYYALLAEIYGIKGDRDKAQEVYEKLLKENPDNPQIQLSICDFLINEKRFDDLFIMLSPVILNVSIAREDKISLFAKLIAIKDFSIDNIDKVLLSLMVFEANYSNDDVIPLLRPEFLNSINRDKEASARLQEIISKNPDNYYAWEKLLFVYLQLGDFKSLYVKGEECATKFNRSFIAKLLYANGALENKEYNIALEELRKAQILAGDNNDYIVQVLTMKADIYYRMKEFNKSFEIFEEATIKNPEDLTILNNYAYYLSEQNMNLKKAESMARMVIEKEKDNPTFLDTYAWVLFKRGKVKDAAKIMESIIIRRSNISAEYYEHYGFMLKSMRKCDKAIDNWTYAMKLDSTKTELKGEIENCKQK
jgi:tetratricopeptide (TPR) repeat protein